MVATQPATRTLVYGDLVQSHMPAKLVRFVRWEPDGFAVVMDRNTLKELPDYVHPTQLGQRL